MREDIVSADISHLLSKVENLENFLNATGLTQVLSNGGYIAGGFPRFLLKTKKLDPAYLNIYNQFGDKERIRLSSSDIDIFFKDPYSQKKAIKLLSQFLTWKKFANLTNNVNNNHSHISWNVVPPQKTSLTTPATDEFLGAERSVYTYNLYVESFIDPTANQFFKKFLPFKIQLIDCTFGDVEDVICKFDLVNSMVAIDNEKVYTHKNRIQAESELSLMVNPDITHGPFLASRLNKYMQKYGYKKIHDSSKEGIKEYVFQLVCENDESPLKHLLPSPAVSSFPQVVTKANIIKRLIKFLPVEYILYFMDKAFLYHAKYDDNYNLIQRYKEDIVLKEIQRRKEDEQSNN